MAESLLKSSTSMIHSLNSALNALAEDILETIELLFHVYASFMQSISHEYETRALISRQGEVALDCGRRHILTHAQDAPEHAQN